MHKALLPRPPGKAVQADLIVGCNAGAVFGARVTAGHPAKECLHLAQTLWSREITSQRRKAASQDHPACAAPPRSQGPRAAMAG